jgi:NADH-quinone oxidoreductase subunit A
MQISGAAWPIFLFLACAVAMTVGMLALGKVLNPAKSNRVREMPYESGMDPIHDTRRRFDIRFNLIAIAFLVFDVELLFLYPWAVAAHPYDPAAATRPAVESREEPTSAAPLGVDAAVAEGAVESRGMVFGGAMAFIALLTLGYVYDWRKGVFRWK